MIETADHSEHRFANRLMTVMAETVEHKKACTAVRQSVQELEWIRHRRALTNTDFEQQLLVLDLLSGIPVATAG